MAKPVVVLADLDEDYVGPLECKLLKELRETVTLEVITSQEYFDSYFSMPHDTEVLLISSDLYSDVLEKQNIEKLIVLTEERDFIETGNLHADYVYKYINLSHIFDKIINSCESLRPRTLDQRDSEVLLFFSPVGGSGKTTTAIATASYFQETYKRVLFLNAEYIQTFKCLLPNGKNAPNSIVNTIARMNDASFKELLDYIESDCFDYFPPLRAGLVTFGLEFEFFARLIETVKESNKYDYIIVDTDSVFNDDKTDLFNLADKVIVTLTQDRLSLFKAESFLDNLDSADREKYHFVCNKYKSEEDNAFAGSSNGSGIVLDGYIEYDTQIMQMNAGSLGSFDSLTRIASTLE